MSKYKNLKRLAYLCFRLAAICLVITIYNANTEWPQECGKIVAKTPTMEGHKGGSISNEFIVAVDHGMYWKDHDVSFSFYSMHNVGDRVCFELRQVKNSSMLIFIAMCIFFIAGCILMASTSSEEE